MNGAIVPDDTSDIESVPDSEVIDSVGIRKIIRWRGPKDCTVTDDIKQTKPGDVIVVSAETGEWESLGDLSIYPDGNPVLDWGDRAHTETRNKAQLRLQKNVIAAIQEWPAGLVKQQMVELAENSQSVFEEDADLLIENLKFVLVGVRDDVSAPQWLKDTAGGLLEEKNLGRCIRIHPRGGFVLQGNLRLRIGNADRFGDEDDGASSGTIRVPLDEHLLHVAEHARRFSEGVGLSASLSEMIARSGALHDLGKADSRFQSLLRNGLPFFGEGLLAKSSAIPKGLSAYQRARSQAGYPSIPSENFVGMQKKTLRI